MNPSGLGVIITALRARCLRCEYNGPPGLSWGSIFQNVDG